MGVMRGKHQFSRRNFGLIQTFVEPKTAATARTVAGKRCYYCVFTSERRIGLALLLASTVVAHCGWLDISREEEAA